MLWVDFLLAVVPLPRWSGHLHQDGHFWSRSAPGFACNDVPMCCFLQWSHSSHWRIASMAAIWLQPLRTIIPVPKYSSYSQGPSFQSWSTDSLPRDYHSTLRVTILGPKYFCYPRLHSTRVACHPKGASFYSGVCYSRPGIQVPLSGITKIWDYILR